MLSSHCSVLISRVYACMKQNGRLWYLHGVLWSAELLELHLYIFVWESVSDWRQEIGINWVCLRQDVDKRDIVILCYCPGKYHNNAWSLHCACVDSGLINVSPCMSASKYSFAYVRGNTAVATWWRTTSIIAIEVKRSQGQTCDLCVTYAADAGNIHITIAPDLRTLTAICIQVKQAWCTLPIIADVSLQ